MSFCDDGGFQIWANGFFTQCFEDFILFGAVNVLFIAFASLRVMQLGNYPLVGVPRARVHITKVSLCCAMAGIPMLVMLHQLLDGTNKPYQIAWCAIMSVTWVVCLVVVQKEYERALPHNWVLRVFWLLTCCCGSFKLRTMIRAYHSHPPTVSSFDFVIYLFQFILMAVMSVMGIFFHKSHEAFDQYEPLREGGRKKYSVFLQPLWSVMRPDAMLMGIGVFCGVVSAILFMAQPYLIGHIIDDVTQHREADSRNRLNTFAAVLVSIYACDAVFHGSHMVLFIVAGERIACRLRSNAFRAIMQQEMSFFDEYSTSELTNLVDEDTLIIQRIVADRLSSSLTQAVNIAAGFCFVFALSWKLTLVMLAMAPIAALCQIANGKIVKGLTKRTNDAVDQSQQVAEETLLSIRTVRAFSKDEREAARYGAAVAIVFRLARRTAVARGICESGAMFAMNACIVMGLWYGGILVLRGPEELTGGELTSYILYTLYIVFSVTQLTGLMSHVNRSVAAAVRIGSILSRRPQMDYRGGLIVQDLRGDLAFDDVHFQFPSRVDGPSLRGVSFILPARTTVALVGPVSGGKSAIAALVERFYDPQQGQITLDGKDLCAYDPRWLRDQIGIVTHDPPMFANSVAKNIGYSRDDATLAEIVEAARQACAHDFICGLPDGYQTIIGEHGVRLTTDQKQRVAIARALLKSPSIVIVSEGTVDLDSEQEQLVQQAMNNLMRGRTSIIVASRLPTMRAAGRIIVVKGGRVIEEGDHDALMGLSDGYYQNLVSHVMDGHHSATAARTVSVSKKVEADVDDGAGIATPTTNIIDAKLRVAADLAARIEKQLLDGDDDDILSMVTQLRRSLA